MKSEQREKSESEEVKSESEERRESKFANNQKILLKLDFNIFNVIFCSVFSKNARSS